MAVYAVLGARGGTGNEIVRRLAELPSADVAEIRAVVRDTSKSPSASGGGEAAWPQDPRFKLMAGDVEDVQSLREALTGVSGLFFAASGSGYEKAIAVDQVGVQNVAVLAKDLGVGRFLLVSSQLVHPANKFNFVRGMINTFATGAFHRYGIMDFKFAGEQLLRRSGQEYVIVRPGRLVDGPLGTARPLIAQTNGHFMNGFHATRSDVAAVCIAAMTAPSAKNTTFELNCETPLKEPDPRVVRSLPADFFDGLKEEFDKSWTEGLAGP